MLVGLGLGLGLVVLELGLEFGIGWLRFGGARVGWASGGWVSDGVGRIRVRFGGIRFGVGLEDKETKILILLG